MVLGEPLPLANFSDMNARRAMLRQLPLAAALRRPPTISSPCRRVAAVVHAASTMAPHPCRSLHYVLKIGNRSESVDFYVKTLLMKVLRHEEFMEGCAAACNGPYDGRWSKTMIGYADEDSSFALELTYNYNVKSYNVGNDYSSITICNKDVFHSLQANGVGKPVQDRKAIETISPDGHKFIITDGVAGSNPITEIALNVEDLERSLTFWSGFLKFSSEDQTAGAALLRSASGQTALRLQELPKGTKIDRGTGYGRIAFACPGEQLQQLEADVKAAGFSIHTPYVSLETPGKATVQVVILQDPDGQEICFVGEQGFRDLSQTDPQAPGLLSDAIGGDKSQEWHERMQRMEAAMAAKGV